MRDGGTQWEFDPSSPIDISIPLRFGGPQPNAYGVDRAVSEACEYGELIGDTRRGGSCNFESYTLIPHCNGTHTECVGHITDERISVRDRLRDVLVPARLVTVDPVKAFESGESYPLCKVDGDRLITSDQLVGTLGGYAGPRAVIIRTNPNDESKMARDYLDDVPPYFSTEAMSLIADSGITHLVCDLPSIDRIHDEGRLANHRLFWRLEPGARSVSDRTRSDCTITELAFIPDHVADGPYLLSVQIAPFESDAAPSRPLLFKPV